MYIKRLSVEEVREAMRSTGLGLVSGLTLDLGNDCGCPIGIMAVSIDREKAFGIQLPEFTAYVDIVGLDWSYATGFVRGFDGWGYSPESDESRMGYDDGRAIREELLDEA